MTDIKARRQATSRARAAIKAQRWALRKERGKHRWRPPYAVAGVAAGGILIGGLLSLALAPADPPGLPAKPANRVAIQIPDNSAAPVLYQSQQAAGAATKAESGSLDSQAVLVPAAGPDETREQSAAPEDRPWSGDLERMVYEEPFHPGSDMPSFSDQEIEAAIQRVVVVPVPDTEVPAQTPLWQRNAVEVARFEGRPMIAIVIDDLGLNRPNARRAIALPPPLTLAFMTYAPGLEDMTAAARALGHELLVHVPMEPSDPSYDPGLNALAISQEPEEVARRLDWALSRFDGYVGINNHMGSKFTSSPLGMAQILAELRSRGLMFLDSRTSGASIGADLAKRMRVAHAARDVFIDNEQDDPEAIRVQLAKLEAIAGQRGMAVGIGHPHDTTLKVLRTWLVEARQRGFAIVPISAIVNSEIETAGSTRPPG